MPKAPLTIDVPKSIKGTKLERKYLDAAKRSVEEQAVLRLFEQGEISSGYAAEPWHDAIRFHNGTRQAWHSLLQPQ